MAIGDNLQKYTYPYLVQQGIAKAPTGVDRRQGSVIFDTISTNMYELANAFQEMWLLTQRTYLLTATGEWLDYRAEEYGVTRRPATSAVRRATMTNSAGQPVEDIPEGSVFSTIDDTAPIPYSVTNPYVDPDGVAVPGDYAVTALTAGVVGNQYVGPIIPIDYIPRLNTATLGDIITPAEDIESDDSLRERALAKVNDVAFGGNVAQYIQWVNAIDGVGACQVYPVWQGGGTVKVSIVDAEYNAVSNDFRIQVWNLLDPENVEGIRGTGIGIAPIDHKVTVDTPIERAIDVTTTLTLAPGTTLDQVRSQVTAVVTAYFREVRENWDNHDELYHYELWAYISQVNARILTIPGIVNVLNTQFENDVVDIQFEQTAAKQELPIAGTVTLFSTGG